MRGVYDFCNYFLGDEAVEAVMTELAVRKDFEKLLLRGNNIKVKWEFTIRMKE